MLRNILAVVFSGAFAGAILVGVGPVAQFQSVRQSFVPSDVWLVDRNGAPLEMLRTVHTYRSLEWVALDDVSPAFVDALVRAEDRRFFDHYGIDVRAFLSALRSTVQGNGVRGASTITMQLVKSLEEEHLNRATGLRRFANKVRQTVRAIRLDASWTKREILEAYINRVSFRGEVKGLRAASLGFFGKSPGALDEIESAVLVVLLRSPNASLEKIQARVCRSLLNLGRDSVEAGASMDSRCLQARELARGVVEQPLRILRDRTIVPVISKDFILGGEKTSVLQTSLDAGLQKLGVTAVGEQLRELKNKNVKDAALLVLETRTGRPLVYVANGGRENSSATQVDGVRSRRQLGSTIKAFVYGAAYDLRLISTTSLLLDSPENVAVGNGQVYQPRNYDHTFRGHVGAAEALGSSLNVPAVRVLSLVSERRVIEAMRKLGFEGLKDDDQYGPSLALGTVDASLWELAQAYRQLSLFSKSNVFSDEAKKQIFESLAVAENRRFTFGVESLLQLPFPVAVKTGTSKDMRDNWCVGYTSEYTVAAWVGNFSGEPMWNVSGITGAAPLWRKMMLALHRGRRPEDPNLNYQVPDQPLPTRTLSRIRYPVPDMLIGLDPDIPSRLQKVPLRVEGQEKDLTFFINGKRVGVARENPFWTPVKGTHRLELKNRVGKSIDHLEFIVR